MALCLVIEVMVETTHVVWLVCVTSNNNNKKQPIKHPNAAGLRVWGGCLPINQIDQIVHLHSVSNLECTPPFQVCRIPRVHRFEHLCSVGNRSVFQDGCMDTSNK